VYLEIVLTKKPYTSVIDFDAGRILVHGIRQAEQEMAVAFLLPRALLVEKANTP